MTTTLAAVGRPVLRRRRRYGSTLMWAALFAGYFAVGWALTVHYNLIDGDGPSRVANAGYTILSRDPHLGAIGFVWNPLPSLVEIPLLWISPLWPELKTLGLAGVVQSAGFMAGAVMMLRRIAFDRGLPTPWRWLAVGTFALNPMIVEYGAVGLSEGAFLFFVLCAMRRILLWLDTRDVLDLTWAGFALGGAYLARYETVAAVAGAVAVVALMSWRRARPAGTTVALQTAVHDAIIVGFPAAAAVIAWAVAGWVLTDQILPQVSSVYGNSSQVEVAALASNAVNHTLEFEAQVVASRILGMQPLVLVIVAIGVAVLYRRRRGDALVPLAMCGAIVTFNAAAQLSGSTFGWFRFYLFVIPLTLVVILTWWIPPASRVSDTTTRSRHLPAVALIAVAVTSLPSTWFSMLDPAIGNQSVQYGLRSIVSPRTDPRDQHYYFQLSQDDRAIARWLDEQNLPQASVVTDTFQSWGIWLASENPDQFVITSDYDFTQILNEPDAYDVRYILVSDPVADGGVDAVNTRYPSMWDDGAGIGSRVMSVAGPLGAVRWRVYAVT